MNTQDDGGVGKRREHPPAASSSRGRGVRKRLEKVTYPVKILNRYLQQRAGFGTSQPKLFFIGFNKTGTKSLHKFFRSNGYLSAHHATYFARRLGSPAIAKIMEENRRAGRPLLSTISHYDVYSDMIHLTASELIEANGFFRELHAQHPDAYFVLNDRPVEKWLRSRLAHVGRRGGSLVKRFAQVMGVSEAEAPDLWREQYNRHKADVLDYFRGNPRFMVFNIEDGSANDLANFLAASFRLDPGLWSQYGSQSQRDRARAAPAPGAGADRELPR